MPLSLIVAFDHNQVIGYKNNLPWDLPEDLQHVKVTTSGGTIVMGRRNFESIGKALPNRRNIILTRNIDYTAKNCEIFHSVEEVLEATKDERVYIFGGEEIYKLFLPYVEKMYITKIYESFIGDTFFPDIKWDEWELQSRQKGKECKKVGIVYYFCEYKRKSQFHKEELYII